MIDTELLLGEFPASEKPGLETFDPRLEEITTAAQASEFDALGPAVAEVLGGGILDVRIVGYYAYLLFHENGLRGLEPAFRGLSKMVTDDWEAAGPVKNRPKITANSLNWFLKLLLKRLQREESSQGPGWSAWIEEIESEEVAALGELCEGLRRRLGAALEDEAGPPADNLSKIADWLNAFERVVYKEPEPEPDPEPEVDGQDDGPLRSTPTKVDGLPVEGSVHLQLLMRKIAAFERLIELEKFARAALVADDINQILGNFDPLLYFPKLFSSYTRVLALNIGELASFDDAKDTRDWQAMQAFFQADLDGFVEV